MSSPTDSNAPAVVRTGLALKEWAAVCRALGSGAVVAVARKGGVAEPGGRFVVPVGAEGLAGATGGEAGASTLADDGFLLFPTYVHQRAEALRADLREASDDERPAGDPGIARLALHARVAARFPVSDPERLRALAPHLPLTPEALEGRFLYGGRPGLEVLVLRVHRIEPPLEEPDRPEYVGCRSWTSLHERKSFSPGAPAADDSEFGRRLGEIRAIAEAGA